MVQKVIEGIVEKVKNVCGEKINIYTEQISQGLVKPCVFVRCTDVEKVNLLGDRYFLRINAELIYDSDSDTKRYEGDSIAADLFCAMGMIEAEGIKIRGRKITSSWNDGKLIVKGLYDVFTKENSDDGALMEKIEVRMG